MHECLSFDEVHLLGIRYHKVTTEQLLDYILQMAKGNGKVTVANVNIRAMNFAYDLSWYRKFINSSELVFCDGFGVAAGSRIMGAHVHAEHRMTCPDWIDRLAYLSALQNSSIFLLGGKPGIALEAANKLRSKNRGLRIDGYHGYFDFHNAENDQVINLINKFQPDILYVGLGMPLQEHWILNNREKLNAHVFLPLGACLDFYTNVTSRGPRWMTDYGLEWLSRLVTEPARLWKRYLIGNPLFFWRVLKQRAGVLKRTQDD